VLLLVAGVYTVHHGRYLIAPVANAHEELGGGPHGYLSLIAPLLSLLAVLAVPRVLRAITRTGPKSRPALWLATSASLIATYALAEFVEGRLDTAHRAGLGGALNHGGASALLIAVAVGAVLALLLKASAAVIRRIAEPAARRLPRAPLSIAFTGRSGAHSKPTLRRLPPPRRPRSAARACVTSGVRRLSAGRLQ
jgi:hypothetical protein